MDYKYLTQKLSNTVELLWKITDQTEIVSEAMVQIAGALHEVQTAQRKQEAEEQALIEAYEQKLYADHDCHLSPDSSCEICVASYESKHTQKVDF